MYIHHCSTFKRWDQIKKARDYFYLKISMWIDDAIDYVGYGAMD